MEGPAFCGSSVAVVNSLAGAEGVGAAVDCMRVGSAKTLACEDGAERPALIA